MNKQAIQLTRLRLRNFKGIRDKTIRPNGQSLSVFGDNSTGKTTLFDAYLWLLTDKDSRGHSTGYFSLKTKQDGKVIPKIEHEVSATLSDPNLPKGKIILTKIFKEKWERSRGDKHKHMKGHTTNYFIDDREVSMRDYQDFVAEIIDEKLLRILTDVYYFAQELDKNDRRNILNGLYEDISIEDIISGNDLLLDYPDILNGLDRKDRQDQLKKQRRKLDKQLDNIPDRIDENQRMIQPVDGLSDAKADIKELESKKETIRGKKSQIKHGGAVADLKVNRQELEAKRSKLENEHNQRNQNELKDLRGKVSQLQDKVDEAESNFRTIKRDYQTAKADEDKAAKQILKITEQINDIGGEQPISEADYQPEACPVCERPYEDAHGYQDYLQEFNSKKANELKTAKNELARVDQLREEKAAKLKQAESKAAKLKGTLSQRSQALEKAQQDLSGKRNKQHPFIETDRCVRLIYSMNEIDDKIANHRQEKRSQLSALDDEIEKINSVLSEKQDILKTADKNNDAQKRIEELRQQQDSVATDLEDIEHQLYVIEQFIQAEAEAITGKVNEKFEIVEWSLFEKQLNGGIKPITQATVNGIPFDKGLNDGNRIKAGLDIISTLSNHYGVSLPVFLDNSESVTSLPETDLQLIALVVSEKDKELRIEKGLPYHNNELELA